MFGDGVQFLSNDVVINNEIVDVKIGNLTAVTLPDMSK